MMRASVVFLTFGLWGLSEPAIEPRVDDSAAPTLYVIVAETEAPDAQGSAEREEIELDLLDRLQTLSANVYDVQVAPDQDSALVLCKAVADCDILLLKESVSSDATGITLKVKLMWRGADSRLRHKPVDIPQPPPEKSCGKPPRLPGSWASCRPYFFDLYVKKVVEHQGERHRR